MVQTIIDLSAFKGGVTINVLFDVPIGVMPFLIFITGPDKQVIFYYRTINKKQVEINLPEHPDQVILFSEKPVLEILIGKIRVTKLEYKFNDSIIVPRDYPFSKIHTEIVPYIPDPITGGISEQPARFLPSKGLKQLSAHVFAKLPQPVGVFINEHENGHYFYGRPIPPRDLWREFSPGEQKRFEQIMQEDEEEADRYAVYSVINKGYNFSNALNAVTDFLSDNYVSQARMNKVFQTIQNEHKNFRYDQ